MAVPPEDITAAQAALAADAESLANANAAAHTSAVEGFVLDAQELIRVHGYTKTDLRDLIIAALP